ncbi:MAG TPA: hypothetical protein VNT79_13180 [Phycisphaerae bacterium]|nr:hypothetical protein [Phycisphaerae bacterium]
MPVGRRAGTLSRWYFRVPAKLLVFLLVTFATLFPNPAQLWRHVNRLVNLDRMIEPDAPGLSQWDTELAELRTAAIEAREASRGSMCGNISRATDSEGGWIQAAVQQFVYGKVQYAWDWETWACADYIPTVEEMFERGRRSPEGQIREDCDGRAVMAASIMKRLGYEPRLVTDLRHVWVETPEGKWMGPGRQTTLVSTPTGVEVDFWGTLSNVPVSLSYGIAVFPFWREMIIAAAAYLLMLHRRMNRMAAVMGGVLIVQGLLFMRLGFMAPQSVASEVSAWPSWLGMVHVAAALGVLLRASYLARRRLLLRAPGIEGGEVLGRRSF